MAHGAAVVLVTFQEYVTWAYHLPKHEVSTAEVKSFSPTESKDSRFWSSGKRGSELKNLISQPQSTAPGNKRALPAAALAVLSNPKVQEIALDKGIDIIGKMVDKTLANLGHTRNKAAEFLKKEIKLDITPDKAWMSDNMMVPSAYHLDASIDGDSKSPVEEGKTPFIYPAGMGHILMNGCWGKDYKIGDPCYNAKENSSLCRVWVLTEAEHSPESRKMSIVQRNCATKSNYDHRNVPDTMNVHGIYETSAFMLTFENSAEYQTYLEHQAGVSKSSLGFMTGVKKAWGGSMQTSTQQFMAALYVDVERYEIFMDEVKPSDLSLSFLREFMELPISYFQPGAQIKYRKEHSLTYPNSTLIEYGKSLGTSDGGDIYLTHLDANDPLPVRFYAFGNMDKVVKIWDAHIIPRDLTDADCKGSTYKDPPTNLCFLKCHEYCDPFAGCKNAGAKDLQPSDCLACRIAKDPKTNVCLEKCPENQTKTRNVYVRV
ncbi:hypothetical protein pdam_00006741 [Pocillopora damicornis]|uniref:MACPF domain-containing protein n=1 Tax=Pocillopora damicornis TaxID=46731 RepID=A0A3M6UVQ6_POCDA|nr:hypothetical protein pdam_00006741 [Pocillopora damicornis]